MIKPGDRVARGDGLEGRVMKTNGRESEPFRVYDENREFHDGVYDDGSAANSSYVWELADKQLTDEDMNSIVYFHREKGDVTRWCEWNEKKHLLQKENPALWHAFQQLEIAQQTLDALLKAL